MHVLICAYALFSFWKWANWREWKKYHATMIFLPMMNLVYNYISISSDYFLWKMQPGIIRSFTIIEFLYTAILLPATVILFLSNYPDKPGRVAVHFIKYIIIYSCAEAALAATGGIEYQHGWSIWHSVVFYFLMFPAIIIHYRKPVIAYIVFISITAWGVWFFSIPIQ